MPGIEEETVNGRIKAATLLSGRVSWDESSVQANLSKTQSPEVSDIPTSCACLPSHTSGPGIDIDPDSDCDPDTDADGGAD